MYTLIRTGLPRGWAQSLLFQTHEIVHKIGHEIGHEIVHEIVHESVHEIAHEIVYEIAHKIVLGWSLGGITIVLYSENTEHEKTRKITVNEMSFLYT